MHSIYRSSLFLFVAGVCSGDSDSVRVAMGSAKEEAVTKLGLFSRDLLSFWAFIAKPSLRQMESAEQLRDVTCPSRSPRGGYAIESLGLTNKTGLDGIASAATVATAMSKDDSENRASLSDLRAWLDQELQDLDRVHALRIKEATGIVEAVAHGEASADEGIERINEYFERWGEALPGAHAKPHWTDKQILERIDKVRAELRTMRMEARRRRDGQIKGERSSWTER